VGYTGLWNLLGNPITEPTNEGIHKGIIWVPERTDIFNIYTFGKLIF
jgi:hypothetical protein